MKVLSYILLLGLVVAHVSCDDDTTIDDPCAEQKIEDCVHTEFAAYMKCIEEKKEMRAKRQAQCPYAQQQQVGYYPVQQQETPQQPNYHNPVVQSNAAINNPDQGMITENHVEYIPQAQGGQRTIIVNNKEGTNEFSNRLPVAGHNITTVINLNNIINNTNIIDSPTKINNTNINNIHIYHNKTSTTGGKFGLGYTEKGSCCFSVRPKACRKTSNGPKCHHHRHKTCGPNCTSRIIHAQVRRRCTSGGDCHRRTAHIPQPQRPRCISTYNWPYVSCGGYQQGSCDGCYDHYGYGYENYYGPGYGNDRCNGCYDDGFEYGPMYRRGPVLRPYHYHETPCEISGTCDGSYYEDDNGYFGHDRIDPAFHEDDSRIVIGDDRYFSDVFNISDSSAADDGLDEESGDWAIQTRKCRVVDDTDGSIQIRNCTVDDLDNEYARSSQGNTHEEEKGRRNTRRSSPYYNYPAAYMAAPPSPYMAPYMVPYMMAPVQYMPPQGQFRRPSEFDQDYGEEDNDEIRYRQRSPKHNGRQQHNKHQRLPVDEEDLDSFKDDDREFDVYGPNDFDQ